MCGVADRLYAKFPTIITDKEYVSFESMFEEATEEQPEWMRQEEKDKPQATYIPTWIVIDLNMVDSYHPTFVGKDNKLDKTIVFMSTGNTHILDVSASVFEEKLLNMLGYVYVEGEDSGS